MLNDINNDTNNTIKKNSKGQVVSGKTKMILEDFNNRMLTDEDYSLIQQLENARHLDLRNQDISKIIHDNILVDEEEQRVNDDFVIKSGVGNPLYKEAMHRQNTRLANELFLGKQTMICHMMILCQYTNMKMRIILKMIYLN